MQKNQKTLATSLTALVFLVVGSSGVLLYFHLFERSVKELHETLGLIFVIAALFHVFFNFNAMKHYFKKKIFLISTAIIVVVSASFILANSTESKVNPKSVIITSVLNAPIEDAVQILGDDMDQFEQKLKAKGIVLKEEASINQLAKSNKTSPFKIIDIITQPAD